MSEKTSPVGPDGTTGQQGGRSDRLSLLTRVVGLVSALVRVWLVFHD